VGNVQKHILSYGAALKRITILRNFINPEMFSSKSWLQNLCHGLIFQQARHSGVVRVWAASSDPWVCSPMPIKTHIAQSLALKALYIY